MIRKKINKFLSAIATIALCIAAVSCDNGYDCELNNTAYDNIGFYANENGEEKPYIYPSPLTVSLMINGNDVVIINHVTETKEISLPMSYTQECDTVIFHYDDGLCDSLYIDHSNTPYYQSMECGTIMFHKLEGLKHTKVWIEKAAIVNKNVNFAGNENIKVYFYK